MPVLRHGVPPVLYEGPAGETRLSAAGVFDKIHLFAASTLAEGCMTDSPRIGFLGAGKMATALAAGWLKAGLAAPGRLCASDPVPAARDAFHQATGAAAHADNA